MIRYITKCPVCSEKLYPTRNLIGTESTWFDECRTPGCNTIVNTKFAATDYQEDFLIDDNQFTGYFGGFGAGKTASSAMKVLIHILDVANGVTLVGADSWPQMLRTNVKELAEIIPVKLVKKGFSLSLKPTSPAFDVTFRNGHHLFAQVLISEESLRSLNLTGFWVEEASVVKYGIFNQLQTRQRHSAAVVYEYNPDGSIMMETFKDNRGTLRQKPVEGKPKYVGVLSSNPDPGWIRTHFLYRTDKKKIHYYGTDPKIRESLKVDYDDKNPFMSSFVVPTTANYYLPADFIPKMSSGKSDAWIKRYVEGSFAFADGLVYPNYANHEVEPFDIPKNWKHIISCDFGRRDPTAYVLAAIDPDTGIAYVYKEYYKPEGEISDWVEGFWELYNPVSPTAWLFPPVGDPAGQSRGQAIAKSWFDLYAEYDINFIPSNTGKNAAMGITLGLAQVSEYFSAGKLKFFSTLTNFKNEIQNYKYDTKSLMENTDEKNKDEKPRGYKDHLMDALRGMVSMFPKNVTEDLRAFTPSYISPGQTSLLNQVNMDMANDPHFAEFWKKPVVDKYEQDFYEDDFGVLYGDAFEGGTDGLF